MNALKNKDGIANTLLITLLICGVFSFLISWTAVTFRPQQQANIQQERKVRILSAAGVYMPETDIDQAFVRFEPRLVNLSSGEFVDDPNVNPLTYDALRAASDTNRSRALSPAEDIAVLRRRENMQTVFLLKNSEGALELIVLPVRGYGLWGTMHGYLALRADLNTVAGLEFYQHKETPGLGGEIESARWKSLWPGKRIFNAQGAVSVEVIKGAVQSNMPQAVYQVDGLAGASLTSKGVTRLLRFWCGQLGYGPLLQKLRQRATNARAQLPNNTTIHRTAYEQL